eukprot:s1466_g6.t1
MFTNPSCVDPEAQCGSSWRDRNPQRAMVMSVCTVPTEHKAAASANEAARGPLEPRVPAVCASPAALCGNCASWFPGTPSARSRSALRSTQWRSFSVVKEEAGTPTSLPPLRRETWLQPLLRNIFGNLTVSVDNLVAKLIRNGAVACVTLERLDSRPQSPSWEAAFTPLTSQPLLYRVVSVRDATMTLDVQQGERQKAQSRRPRARSQAAVLRNQRQVALPILHRVSAEIFIEWPWLPWPAEADAPPTSRLGLHLSPIRARLGSDQVQVLAQLLGPEVPEKQASSFSGGLFDAEVDSESDRFSLMSGGGSSRTLGDVKATVSRQATPLGEALASPRGDRPTSCPATPSKGPPSKHVLSTSSLPEEEVSNSAVETGATGGSTSNPGGFRSFLADVLFGDDEDEEPEEEETPPEGPRTARETRRIITFAATLPLFSLSLEQTTGTPEEMPLSYASPWNAGL